MEAYDRLISWGVRKSKEARARDEKRLKANGYDMDELGVKWMFWFFLSLAICSPAIYVLDEPFSWVAVGIWFACVALICYFLGFRPYRVPKVT